MVPEAQVEALVQMYTAEEEDALLDGQPDYVIDAIDNIDTKVALLAACKRRGIPVICVAGAGDGTNVLTPQDSDNVPNISADEGKECCLQWHTMPSLCILGACESHCGWQASGNCRSCERPLLFGRCHRKKAAWEITYFSSSGDQLSMQRATATSRHQAVTEVI